MSEIKVYFDFDGVMGDTMAPAIKEMKELNLYDTEEGRTKYFKELNWSNILAKTPYIKNSILTINTLFEMGYETPVLTHVNSFNEHIDKINHIKNNEEIKNREKINVIAVPRIIDKSIPINPNGDILFDDRLENIIVWEAMGGIGVYFSSNQHDSYITINDPIELINIVLSLDKSDHLIYLSGNQIKDEVLLRKVKEKTSKEPVENDFVLENISLKINKYKTVIDRAIKYHNLIISKRMVNYHYDFQKMDRYLKTIKFYQDLVDKKILHTQKLCYDIYYDLLEALILIKYFFEENSKKDNKDNPCMRHK